jgi:transposase
MRGSTDRQVTFLAITPDQLVAPDHPIRKVKPFVVAALKELNPLFDEMYAKDGRPSVPPEHLLKACLLMAFYSIRSERQFCERLQYDLLFKWFLDLNIEDVGFDFTSFNKNRERLLKHDVGRRFFEAVLIQARQMRLLSSEHFTVDGTLLESWASLKSFQPRNANLGGQRKPKRGSRRTPPAPAGGGRNPEVNFHGEKRSNETHASTTDPEARLARKGNGREAKLSFAGHVLMENRNGLAVDVMLTQATGTAEREAALKMIRRERKRAERRITVGADKGYDTTDFVDECRELEVTPHVAQNVNPRRRSRIDGRTTSHSGYVVSQRVRKRVEEIFGWIKVIGGGRKMRYLGVRRNQLWAEFATAAYNLVRIGNLAAEAA